MTFRAFAEEFVGTFGLVFIGTGGIILDAKSGGAVTPIGVSLIVGVTVSTMILLFGKSSGAHINPAVTVGFWIARTFPGRNVLPYVAVQCLGAIAASGVLWLMASPSPTWGETLPTLGVFRSLLLETGLTVVLTLVVLRMSHAAHESGVPAALVIGGTVAVAAYFGGPYSGASMNPARSLGPALVSHHLEVLWIYVAGPVAGAIVAAKLWLAVRRH